MRSPNLSAGYSLRESDPEFVKLLGPDGDRVGVFGAWATPEEIERLARDHSGSLRENSRVCPRLKTGVVEEVSG